MHAWSAAQSASPPKHPIVAAQQSALSLMHVLQFGSSKARFAFPRHVSLVDAPFVVAFVAACTRGVGCSSGTASASVLR
jgi:hypothetical protein